MTVTAPRKYNPGFLTDGELVASFCVRMVEFESIVEMLRECTGSSNPHQIVIGPRGSGKTSLLLRVAAEVRRDAGLSSAFFPVVFAEESYEVANAGEFWLECLFRLADQAPHREGGPDLRLTFEHLRTIRDDRTLGERCMGVLQDFSDRESKRLVLMVENLNMMFSDMADPDAGWRLRKVLQTEPRIILLASATSRFDEIDNPDCALFDQFRTLTLRPLDTSECAVLWERVSGRCAPPETIRSLEILTGGSPRLIAIVARFGEGLSFRELMADLLNLVDDHTEYFKSHLESLPAQERRVYLALADLWKPAFTKEVADRARLETSKCSAQLTRLVERGAVLVAGGTIRRKQYYLSERLYNIYYLLRRNRGPNRLIEALIRFMASYYSPHELKDISVSMVREAGSLDPEMRSLYQVAFGRFMELPELSGHREDLLAVAPPDFMKFLDRDPVHPGITETTTAGTSPDKRGVELFHGNENEFAELAAAGELLGNAWSLYGQNQVEDALAKYDELARRFGESDVPGVSALVAFGFSAKGVILTQLDRQEDALAAYDDVVLRLDSIDVQNIFDQTIKIFADNNGALGELRLPNDMQREVMDSWNEMAPLIRAGDISMSSMIIAGALVAKGGILFGLNRPEEALAAYDDVMHRIGENTAPVFIELLAAALVSKGAVLNRLNRLEEALVIYDETVHRFDGSETLCPPGPIVVALVNKGLTLVRLNKLEEALSIFDEVEHRFGTNEAPNILEQLATALFTKGDALTKLNRTEEALTAFGELARRFGTSEMPVILAWIGKSLVKKGEILRGLGRLEEALIANDEVIHRFEESSSPVLVDPYAAALVDKGLILHELDRSRDALACFDKAVRRFSDNDTPIFHQLIAFAFYGKASVLTELNRTVEALPAYDEAARRFETSEDSVIRAMAGRAFLSKADLELKCGRYDSAIQTVGRILDRHLTESVVSRWQGHLIRAKANLAGGAPSDCEEDVEAMLTILTKLDSLPREGLDALMALSIDLGPTRMRELIQASPAADLLLPLTTALEWELGLEPRVAREVEEVARDIRRDLAKLKEARANGVVQGSDSEGEGDPVTA